MKYLRLYKNNYITLLLISFTIQFNVNAQILPDRVQINMEEIELFATEGDRYEKLIAHMKAADTLLRKQDYVFLYYGFQFRKEYKGSNDPNLLTISNLIKEEKKSEALEATKRALDENPVSLRLLLHYIQLGTELTIPNEELRPVKNNLIQLSHIIASTGDGRSTHSPFHVIAITDEYVLMHNYLGIKEIKNQNLIEEDDRYFDYFNIIPVPSFYSNVIYFDITPSMLKMQEMFE